MNYTKLIVWQKADELAYEVYIISKKFPREEQFGLTSQLRRAVVSIPTNIVEGVGRQNRNETKQFANIALGSLAETDYLLKFCHRLNFLTEEDYKSLLKLKEEVGSLLWRFHRSFL